MAKVYADLIRKGKKTIDDVPEILREDVQKILNGIPRQCHPLPEPLQELSTLFLCFHSSPLQTLFHRASGVMVSKRKPDNKAGHGYFC